MGAPAEEVARAEEEEAEAEAAAEEAAEVGPLRADQGASSYVNPASGIPASVLRRFPLLSKGGSARRVVAGVEAFLQLTKEYPTWERPLHSTITRCILTWQISTASVGGEVGGRRLRPDLLCVPPAASSLVCAGRRVLPLQVLDVQLAVKTLVYAPALLATRARAFVVLSLLSSAPHVAPRPVLAIQGFGLHQKSRARRRSPLLLFTTT